jgi:protein tyrosine phosphatase (PTP) superfamily phosphohydrolase (DUF442 family)
MKIIAMFTVLSFLAVGCAQHNKKEQTNIKITKSLVGHKYGNIYFSGQPSKEDLLKLKESDFSAVINLREKKENNYFESWEKEIVTKQGIVYKNIPFSMKKELTDEYIKSVVSEVVKNRKKGKVLVHCSSGNRAALFVGGHFLKDHNYSKENAMKIAKEYGLKKEKAQQKLQSYLDKK